MDIRRNPFPSSFMTAPGGLEYLKMPMGLVQSTPTGELIPAGPHATIAHPNGTITHQHMTTQHVAAVSAANQQHARGKGAVTTAHTLNILHPETHYVQSNQHQRPNTTAPTSYHQTETVYRTVYNAASAPPLVNNAPQTIQQEPQHVSRQRIERDEEPPSAVHHAVGAGQQNAAVQVEQKPAVISSAVSSTVVAVRDPSIRPKYVCEICNKGFKSGYNLKRHTNDYHGENSSIIAAKASHICALCAKPFLSSHNLKRHTEDFHSDNKLTYHCEICRKNFQNRFNLKRHRIGVHSGPNGQFQCEICAKSFHYQSNLTRHRKDEHKSGPGFPGTQVVVHPSHKVVKQKHPALLAIGAPNAVSSTPAVAAATSATVVSTSSPAQTKQPQPQQTIVHQQTQHQTGTQVQQHVSQHQPQQQQQQQQQPQQIIIGHVMQNGQIVQQVQAIPIAVPQTPIPSKHVCDLCQKSFTNAYNLKRHKVNVHRDTKILYRCDACGKDFPSVANFTRHRNLVHGNGETGYQCEICDKTFASKDGLKRHISAIHGNPAKELTTVDTEAISSSSNLC